MKVGIVTRHTSTLRKKEAIVMCMVKNDMVGILGNFYSKIFGNTPQILGRKKKL